MSTLMLIVATLFIAGGIVFQDDKLLGLISIATGNIILILAMILDKLEKMEKRK